MSAKQTRLGAILAVLVAVMIATYAQAFRRQPAVDQPPARAQGPSEPVPPVGSAAATERARLAPVPPDTRAQRDAQRARAMRLGWGRDPFNRPESRRAIAFTLSGILWDATRPLAIINDRTLYVGDHIEGYRIVEIMQDHVAITDGTETLTLVLSP